MISNDIQSAIAKIRILCGPLTMDPMLTEEDMRSLVLGVYEPFHDPSYRPFSSGWSSGEPWERCKNYGRWLSARRLDAGDQNRFTIVFMACIAGEIIGSTSIIITNIAERSIRTGSWLRCEYQGRGFGHLMRHCVLSLAFKELGVDSAYSEAFRDNIASIAVNRRAGYTLVGSSAGGKDGYGRELQQFVLRTSEWDPETSGDQVIVLGASHLKSILNCG